MDRILAMVILSIMTSPSAFSETGNLFRHGYIDTPSSRAFLCSASAGNINKMCGSVQYEPQSVEGAKGFPDAGPADGHLAGGGNPRFEELNEQSSTRWGKVDMASGENIFSWTLTAPHSTASWRYFITKENWDPDKPLTRSAFDLVPFCSRDDKGEVPTNKVSMTCNVPKREGYQIILGVWDIADTGNAFYQVIDANFVNNRVNRENTVIDDKIDQQFISDIIMNKAQNESADSVTYHLQVVSKTKPSSIPEYQWFLPKGAKNVADTKDKVSFSLDKTSEVQLEQARVRVSAGKSEKMLMASINVPEINHEVNYEYIFPDNIVYYTAGTRVYQPVNKKIYQCRPFPNSGFCVQWKTGANQYEPGVGFAWTEAWTEIK